MQSYPDNMNVRASAPVMMVVYPAYGSRERQARRLQLYERVYFGDAWKLERLERVGRDCEDDVEQSVAVFRAVNRRGNKVKRLLEIPPTPLVSFPNYNWKD